MLFARIGKVTFALFALWLCLAARPAQAQIDIVNNLSQPNTGLDPVSGSTWQAAAFQVDNHTYTLSSVTLPLVSTNPGGLITVNIYSNTGANQPGAPLFSLGTATLTNALTQTTFFPTASLTLQPNTVYWIVANTPASIGDTNPVGWAATSSTAYTGVGTIPPGFAFAGSGDAGTTWGTHPLSAGPNQFRVTATTPEPGAIALAAGLGLTGIAASVGAAEPDRTSFKFWKSSVPPTKRRTKKSDPDDEILEIRPDQKLCRRCGNLVPRELQRCSFCRHAPWTWHPNSRLLIITLIICFFLFIVVPYFTSSQKTYRTPIRPEEAQH